MLKRRKNTLKALLPSFFPPSLPSFFLSFFPSFLTSYLLPYLPLKKDTVKLLFLILQTCDLEFNHVNKPLKVFETEELVHKSDRRVKLQTGDSEADQDKQNLEATAVPLPSLEGQERRQLLEPRE